MHLSPTSKLGYLSFNGEDDVSLGLCDVCLALSELKGFFREVPVD